MTVWCAVAVLATVAATSLQGSAAVSAIPSAAERSVAGVAKVNGPGNGHHQYGVAALTENDGWAVGRRYTPARGAYAWTRHWDGTAWTQVRPAPALDGAFNSVAMVSSDDVWAVGEYVAPGGSGFPEIMTQHWDGSTWTQVVAGRLGGFSTFQAVSALSSSDVWAVGTNGQAVAEHWDGHAWSQVSTPKLDGDFVGFYGVDAIAADDAYAVGIVQDSAHHPLIEHWDGTAWTRQHIRAPANSWFFSVSGSAADDVWAVGATLDNDDRRQPFAAHWDGTRWTTITTAPSHATTTETADVVTLSPTDAWIVGYRRTGRTHTLTEHWDGTAWTRVHAADRGDESSALYDVAATDPNNLLAVGDFQAKGKDRGLSERWDGSTWTVLR
jgi:hypothetical protein